MLNSQAAIIFLVFLLLVEVAGVLLMIAAWRWLAHLGVRLLPRERRGTVPWTGVEVVFAILVFFLFRGVVYWFLDAVGFYQWMYPPGLPDGDANSQWPALAIRKGLWCVPLALPFQIGLILLFFRNQVGARLYHFGLTLRRAGQNAMVGLFAWLTLAPLVLFLHLALLIWYQAFTGAKPEEHALGELGRANLLRVEWSLLVFTALVAAPVLEEFVYRGVLQPWFMGRSWGGLAAVSAALLVALYARASKLQ